MVEEIKKCLQDVLGKVNGLYCIIISDRDGVSLFDVYSENAPDNVMKPHFVASFGIVVDHGSKLGLGKTTTLICSYKGYQVIQVNKLPLVITFITSESCNGGQVLGLLDELSFLINDLTLAVSEV